MAGKQGWDCKSWFEFAVWEIWAPCQTQKKRWMATAQADKMTHSSSVSPFYLGPQ